MAVTESRKKANAKWDAANLDRMSLALHKGKKDAIKAAAALAGESMNQYIGNAIAWLEREKVKLLLLF